MHVESGQVALQKGSSLRGSEFSVDKVNQPTHWNSPGESQRNQYSDFIFSLSWISRQDPTWTKCNWETKEKSSLDSVSATHPLRHRAKNRSGGANERFSAQVPRSQTYAFISYLGPWVPGLLWEPHHNYTLSSTNSLVSMKTPMINNNYNYDKPMQSTI